MGEDMTKFIQESSEKTLNEMILVRRIKPPTVDSILYRNSDIELIPNTLQEIGFYQMAIYQVDQSTTPIIYQNQGDILVRTKQSGKAKGSMKQGISFIDCLGHY